MSKGDGESGWGVFCIILAGVFILAAVVGIVVYKHENPPVRMEPRYVGVVENVEALTEGDVVKGLCPFHCQICSDGGVKMTVDGNQVSCPGCGMIGKVEEE